MAASVPENWACINGDDDEFDQFKVNEIDSDLLMSLLEELHGEECDDERLTSMIRSLEAEINPIVMDGHDLPMHNSDSCQPSDAAQVDGQDCSMAHDLDLHWMHVEMAPASPSDEMTNWYMDPCGDEFDGVRDHSQNLYGVVHLEELSYGSLWQETHTSVMDWNDITFVIQSVIMCVVLRINLSDQEEGRGGGGSIGKQRRWQKSREAGGRWRATVVVVVVVVVAGGVGWRKRERESSKWS
ncbi:hypothetical protein Acr_19g0005420 [Actinidia rufa]|uniref:Uncharacterized protein n=1 Tax=Actinidia rufa TaxID=165716 RepID=A0A7J0G9V8_9ERIC|nr:hypothetical protein Acr_19g0005420 [Actinidia rufa]